MKWIKRILLLVAIVIVMAIVVSMASYWMLRREPEWYVKPNLTPEMRQAAAARVQHQFSRVGEMAANLRTYEARRQKAIRDGTTLPANEVPGPITVRLTQDEINAFYTTHAKFKGWDEDFAKYVTDPQVVLQDDRLIIAGRVPELQGIIVSMHFAPGVDDNGQLHMDMVRILGGKLPLPEAMVSKYRAKLEQSLTRNLPRWQRSATMDSNGLPNEPAVSAAMAKLLLNSINQQPADSTVFLPLSTRETQYIPVKLTAAKATKGEIEFTLSPLSETQRSVIIEKIREPYPIRVAAKSQ
jgi:uncharacterized protein YpmS